MTPWHNRNKIIWDKDIQKNLLRIFRIKTIIEIHKNIGFKNGRCLRWTISINWLPFFGLLYQQKVQLSAGGTWQIGENRTITELDLGPLKLGTKQIGSLKLICKNMSIIFHQPRFSWNKVISFPQLPFGVRSCEVAIIWRAHMHHPGTCPVKNPAKITVLVIRQGKYYALPTSRTQKKTIKTCSSVPIFICILLLKGSFMNGPNDPTLQHRFLKIPTQGGGQHPSQPTSCSYSLAGLGYRKYRPWKAPVEIAAIYVKAETVGARIRYVCFSENRLVQ